ncbi:hypothetical protein [Streptomyces sp. NPDC101455]|uniref:hypothetical protein n=1 Tax=Streptomyces sp. NPDC101455 TaxID=3366142 RepID=UPI003810F116
MRGIWPHSDALTPWYRRKTPGDLPSADVRMSPVTSSSDVEVDDLIVLFGHRANCSLDLVATVTTREAIEIFKTDIVRVIAKTDRTLTVVKCVLPGMHWSEHNLADFGESQAGASSRTIRLSAGRRQIGRLGALAAIHQRIATHRSFEEWKAAYTEAATELEEEQAHWAKAARDERQRLRPLLAAVKHINQVTGEVLVEWTSRGLEAALGRDGNTRLRPYIAGLHATGLLSDDAYEQVQASLDVVGCPAATIPQSGRR